MVICGSVLGLGNWINGERFRRYRFAEPIQAEIDRLKPDNWHAFLALIEDYAIIAACIALCLRVSWWLYPIAVLVIGARQRGMSTVLHDAAHGVCARNRYVNALLGTVLTAYPIFQRHFPYKESHVQTHHPLLGDPHRDPDLNFFIKQGAYDRRPERQGRKAIVWWPMLGTRSVAYLGYLVRYRFVPQKRGSEIQRALSPRGRRLRALDRAGFYAFWLTVAAVSVYFHVWLLVLAFWVVPYMTAFHTLGWFIELSEHSPLVAQHDLDLYMTRNRRSRGLELFLTGIHNDHHHLDHHLDPRTPFYHLPAARRLRLGDAEYAAIDARTGGLWTAGPSGAPSAISVIVGQLADGAMAPVPPTIRDRSTA